MKLYSDTLDSQRLAAAARAEGLYLELASMSRPRKRARGWTVRLSNPSSRRHRNSGTHGAATWELDPPASWDDHGRWMARLYDLDPGMVVAEYDGAADFHRATRGAFKQED